MKTDIYDRITGAIVAELEKGVRPWLKPWNAEHAAGRITRPLRHNGLPYQGINVVMLWSAAVAQGFAAPIWMTFKQAQELKAHVRKGEKGNLVVYASTVTRTQTDEETGEEQERDIPFLKGYTVFNVEQIEGLPAHFYARPEPRLDPVQRIDHAEAFFAATGAEIRNGVPRPTTPSIRTMCRCRSSRPSAMPRATTPPWRMSAPTGRGTPPGSIATSAASAGAMKATPWRSLSLYLDSLHRSISFRWTCPGSE